MHPPHANLYSVNTIREIERRAIDTLSLLPGELMLRAATAALECVRRHWPAGHRLLIVCGPGNNGGDGMVLARLALQAGLEPRVLIAKGRAPTRGDALAALEAWLATGNALIEYQPGDALGDCDLLVDAVFGIGLDRPPEPPWSALIEAINSAARPVLALDLPSGLDADRGRAPGACVRAERTLTFIAGKPGLASGLAMSNAGELELAPLGLSDTAFEGLRPAGHVLQDRAVQSALGPRDRAAHKGAFGHVHAIGGDHGMGGALRLCAEAALRCGAGRVSAWTRPLHVGAMIGACPEIMAHAGDDPASASLDGASVIAFGPGLGRGEWAQAWCDKVQAQSVPVVADADALNAIAMDRLRAEPDWVLTPHPGEAARLLGSSVADIEADRWAAVTALARRYGCSVVLKGQGSLVAAPGLTVRVCPRGNPGMASAGMGDTLTGIIAALIAQGLESYEAACIGVHLHAWSGDLAAAEGERGLLARDLLKPLRHLCNPNLEGRGP